jgi:exosome complex component RRP41
MQHTIASAFASVLLLNQYRGSTIQINIHVLSEDGSMLAACLNAATLALADAGIPMVSYLAACTVGTAIAQFSAATGGTDNEISDPLLDLNHLEEQELPFMTIATVKDNLGALEEMEFENSQDPSEQDKVVVCMMETRVRMEKLEEMLAVSRSGCHRIHEILDTVIRAHGRKLLQNAAP